MLSVVKKILLFPEKVYCNIMNWMFFQWKSVEFETYPAINGTVFIRGNGSLKFGKNVQLNSSRSSNPIGGDSKLIIALGTKGKLYIGDNTGISNAAIIAHKSVHIGKNVKIGGGVKIYDTDFHSLNPMKRNNKFTDIPKTKEIAIHDNAFIGAHSIILKGVSIGANSIIGAGSVVSKSVPENEIWGGNPAKFIKELTKNSV